jgi:hypothetical protein
MFQRVEFYLENVVECILRNVILIEARAMDKAGPDTVQKRISFVPVVIRTPARQDVSGLSTY